MFCIVPEKCKATYKIHKVSYALTKAHELEVDEKNKRQNNIGALKWHQARSWYNKQKLSRKFASEFSGTHVEGENLDNHRVHNFQRITPHKQTQRKPTKNLRKV